MALALAAICDRSKMVRGYEHSLAHGEPDGSFAVAVNQAGEPAVILVIAPGHEVRGAESSGVWRHHKPC